MSEKKQPVDLGLLEEDDEFEEFPAEGNRLGRADGDSGLRWEVARRRAPARRRLREVETPAAALEALHARPFVRPALGSQCHGGAPR